MSTSLRALIIEDSEDDALQVLRLLKDGGYDVEHERVESLDGMRVALDRRTWDIVISDFNMPGFDGAAALALLRERDPDLPFILVSGTIGEETAVAMMQAGATDYIMKNNIARLAPAVKRELREAQFRNERRGAHKVAENALRESEMRLAGIVGSAMDAIISVSEDSRIVLFNAAAEKMFGRKRSEVIDQLIDQLIPQRFRDTHGEHLQRFAASGITSRAMSRLGTVWGLRASGEEFPIEASFSQVQSSSGKVLTVIVRDITERKQRKDAVRASELRYRRLFEAAKDGILILDANTGQIVDVNPYLVDLLGISHEEFLSKKVLQTFLWVSKLC